MTSTEFNQLPSVPECPVDCLYHGEGYSHHFPHIDGQSELYRYGDQILTLRRGLITAWPNWRWVVNEIDGQIQPLSSQGFSANVYTYTPRYPPDDPPNRVNGIPWQGSYWTTTTIYPYHPNPPFWSEYYELTGYNYTTVPSTLYYTFNSGLAGHVSVNKYYLPNLGYPPENLLVASLTHEAATPILYTATFALRPTTSTGVVPLLVASVLLCGGMLLSAPAGVGGKRRRRIKS